MVLALIEYIIKVGKEEEGGKNKEGIYKRVLKYENDFAAGFITY